MITQLNPPLPLTTPKGRAWAVALIDYGPQWDLQWITFVRETGECWTFRNSQIRQEQNFTHGLPSPSPISGKKPDGSKERAGANGHNGYHAAGLDGATMRPILTDMPGMA